MGIIEIIVAGIGVFVMLMMVARILDWLGDV